MCVNIYLFIYYIIILKNIYTVWAYLNKKRTWNILAYEKIYLKHDSFLVILPSAKRFWYLLTAEICYLSYFIPYRICYI
jgi:hypothetical protein